MSTRRRLLRSAGAWTALLVLTSSGVACPPAEPTRPNVLLVTIDTLRADHVGSYGYPHPTTPQIDRLAGEGAVFEVAYAPMGTTTPSHATLFTSRHPLAHGVVRNGLALLEGEVTLPEVLKRHGYLTGAFVSSFPLSRRFGLAQGFDHYDDEFEEGGDTFRTRKWAGHRVDGRFDRRGTFTMRAVLAWLRTLPPGRPVFLWVHFFDPHGPYVAPKKYQDLFPLDEGDQFRKRRARYDAEIRFADAQVGRLVEAFAALPAEEPPLVIVTSDHGEGLSDHGWPDHDLTLYEEELRVPWVVHWPGRLPAGARSKHPAHLIDVAPTLLGWLGIDAEPAFEGEDLSGVFSEPEARAPERPLWLNRPYYPDGHPRAGSHGWGFGVRVGDWKLIEAPEENLRELYDLERDPRERVDLAAKRPRRVQAMSGRIREWRRAQAAKATDREEGVSAEVREALEALGYGATGPDGEEPAAPGTGSGEAREESTP